MQSGQRNPVRKQTAHTSHATESSCYWQRKSKHIVCITIHKHTVCITMRICHTPFVPCNGWLLSNLASCLKGERLLGNTTENFYVPSALQRPCATGHICFGICYTNSRWICPIIWSKGYSNFQTALQAKHSVVSESMEPLQCQVLAIRCQPRTTRRIMKNLGPRKIF